MALFSMIFLGDP